MRRLNKWKVKNEHDDFIHEVATKKPNANGIYDMTGNVWEWCWEQKSESRGAWDSWHVIRGGGSILQWEVSASITAESRSTLKEASKDGDAEPFGFRLVRNLSPHERVQSEQITKEVSSTTANDEVRVGNFYILKTEVTQQLYAAVTGRNPSEFKGDRLPVDSVSWYDAVKFCNLLSESLGLKPCYSVKGSTNPDTWGKADDFKWNSDKKQFEVKSKGDYGAADVKWDKSADGYRLPTSAEWYKAANDGHEHSGSDNADEVAWYENNSGGRTHEVASKKPNARGLYDMSGNVAEWCWDKKKNDWGATSVVYRGDFYDISYLFLDYEHDDCPNYEIPFFGFRLVRNAK